MCNAFQSRDCTSKKFVQWNNYGYMQIFDYESFHPAGLKEIGKTIFQK